MLSINFHPLNELAKYNELFEAASHSSSVSGLAGERKGFWTRKNDRAGIKEKVAGAKGVSYTSLSFLILNYDIRSNTFATHSQVFR
jgi:hypothetical protein